MKIESKSFSAKATSEQVYNFLTDLNNILELLPQDKVKEWKGNTDKCSFKVSGAPIELVKKNSTPNEVIRLQSGENPPFPYTLEILLQENAGITTGKLHFEGEVNSFLKMMVQKPLTNLFEFMAEKIEEKSY